MLRIRTLGLALVAVFALSSVAASAASAAKPEYKGSLPNAFTIKSNTIVFSVPGSITFTCSSGTGQGELTADPSKKAGTVTLKWGGCLYDGTSPCQSPGAKDEIKTFPLETTLGYINKKSGEVGEALTAAKITEFECANVSFVVEGGVIGALSPANTNTNKFGLNFNESGGIQVPSKFEAHPTETLRVSVDGSKFVPMTIKAETALLMEALTEVLA